MINSNEKSYMVCDNCSKIDYCHWVESVKETVNQFKNTPLNIHFPMCQEYKSWMNTMFAKSEEMPFKETRLSEEDMNDIMKLI